MKTEIPTAERKSVTFLSSSMSIITFTVVYNTVAPTVFIGSFEPLGSQGERIDNTCSVVVVVVVVHNVQASSPLKPLSNQR